MKCLLVKNFPILILCSYFDTICIVKSTISIKVTWLVMTELLDVRHGASPPSAWGCPTCAQKGSGQETYQATPSPSPSAARQLSSRRCVWGGYVGKQFLKGGHHLLFQNVTAHVGIHVSLNEPQLPSTSSIHAAPDHDATTTTLDYSEGTIFLVLLTRASPHMLDTIWLKQVYLWIIRPQDMVPVIHALCQVGQKTVWRLFCEPASEEATFWGQRPCKPTCCSVWHVVWALKSWPSTSATSKAMLAALMHLFFEASFCTWRKAQGLNFFDRPLRGLFRVKPVFENLCMTLATVYCQGVTDFLIA